MLNEEFRKPRCNKHIRPDLALLEVAQEDAIWPPRQQPGQVGLAHRQR